MRPGRFVEGYAHPVERVSWRALYRTALFPGRAQRGDGAAGGGIQHAVRQRGGARRVQLDNVSAQGLQRAHADVDAGHVANAHPGNVFFRDKGLNRPVRGVEHDGQRLPGLHPDAGSQLRVKIAQNARKRRRQLHARLLAFKKTGFGQKLVLLPLQLGAPLFTAGQTTQTEQLLGPGIGQAAGPLPGKPQVWRLQREQYLALPDAALLRESGEPAGQRRIDDLLTLGMQPADAAHARMPREHCHEQKDRQQQPGRALAVEFDLGLSGTPHLELVPHRPPDEPDQLDAHEEDAQHLEGEVIHQHSNAQKNPQTVKPGREGKGDQQGVAMAGRALGPGLFKTQQCASEPGAGQRAAPLVQVGEVQQVGQDEIAVEAHEGADIDEQRQHPTGRGQEK